MRKVITILPAGAVIALVAVAALQTSASAALPSGATSTARPASSPLSFRTRMGSYAPTPGPWTKPSAGDGYVISGRVIRLGKAGGLSTAQCTYTVTSGPVLRVCTVDYALNNGLIATSGYINGSAAGAPVTLVVDGGTGAYRFARGYGKLRPTSTGSDVTLHLTG